MSCSSRSRLSRGLWGFLALALLLGACSDSGQDAAGFTTGYRGVTETLERDTMAIQERAELASGQGIDAILGVYKEILDTTAAARDRLAELEAPDDFESTFDEMVEVIDRQVSLLADLVAAAEERNLADVSTTAGELTNLTADWESLEQAMEELFAACGERCSGKGQS